jgi:hypothetical protein
MKEAMNHRSLSGMRRSRTAGTPPPDDLGSSVRAGGLRQLHALDACILQPESENTKALDDYLGHSRGSDARRIPIKVA